MKKQLILKVQNKEVNILQKQKHFLICEYDKGNINTQTFNKQLLLIENNINALNDIYIEQRNNEINKKQDEVINMAEKIEKPKVVDEPKTTKKVGTKPKKDSMASIVANALMRKGIKSFESLVKKVQEAKPEVESKKIILVGKTIIKECKNSKGRWRNYNWSDELFLLTLKEPTTTS